MCHRIFMQNRVITAQISIKELGIIEGYLQPKASAPVVEWASIHHQEIVDNWKMLSESGAGTFKKIEPLR